MTNQAHGTLHHWTLHLSRQVVRGLVYRWALSDRDLERRLGLHFPIVTQRYLITLTLDRPRIELHEARNRIALAVDLHLHLPGGLTAFGQLHTESGLHYVPSQGAFYLIATDITDLSIRPLPRSYLKPIRLMIRAVLTRHFVEHPVFRFRNDSLRHRLVRQLVRDVEVRRGKLRVNFRLRPRHPMHERE